MLPGNYIFDSHFSVFGVSLQPVRRPPNKIRMAAKNFYQREKDVEYLWIALAPAIDNVFESSSSRRPLAGDS
jgi:hypothetical protein